MTTKGSFISSLIAISTLGILYQPLLLDIIHFSVLLAVTLNVKKIILILKRICNWYLSSKLGYCRSKYNNNTINSGITGALGRSPSLKMRCFYGKKLRKQAYSLIDEFSCSFNQSARFSAYDIEVQNMIHDTLQILENPKASYKASDYAISRFYARISKLIEFHSIKISDETKNWNAFVQFFQSDALKDVRAVGGPLI